MRAKRHRTRRVAAVPEGRECVVTMGRIHSRPVRLRAADHLRHLRVDCLRGLAPAARRRASTAASSSLPDASASQSPTHSKLASCADFKTDVRRACRSQCRPAVIHFRATTRRASVLDAGRRRFRLLRAGARYDDPAAADPLAGPPPRQNPHYNTPNPQHARSRAPSTGPPGLRDP
jgi:hypothetical protein